MSLCDTLWVWTLLRKVSRQHSSMDAKVALEGLLQGSVRAVEFAGGQTTVDAPRRRRVYLPGSFNPLHDGHRFFTLPFVLSFCPCIRICSSLQAGSKGCETMKALHFCKSLQLTRHC